MSKFVSVLIPTRNRVPYLSRLLQSLDEKVELPELTDIWVYYDEDDQATATFAESYRGKIATHFYRGPRTLTMGEMLETLQHQAKHSEIFLMTVDDVLFLTKNWDGAIRHSFAPLLDGIAMGYVDDLNGDLGAVSLVTLSREWLQAAQMMLTPYFPFWYDDLWLDQVALMVDRKIAMPVQASYQSSGNLNGRMRNLAFWDRFFFHTADERLSAAERLRQTIFAGDPNGWSESRRAALKLQRIWNKRGQRLALDEIYYTEARAATEARFHPPGAQYCEVERRAVEHLAHKSLLLRKAGRASESAAILEGIPYAAQRYVGVESGEVVATGFNEQAYPMLRGWRSIRYRLLPLILRIQRLSRVLTDQPVQAWPRHFREIVRRWIARRRLRSSL